MSNEQERQPKSGEQAVQWVEDPWLPGPRSMGGTVLRQARERAAAGQAYILDGLHYARERGWPDQPMMTRQETLEQAVRQSVLDLRGASILRLTVGGALLGVIRTCLPDAARELALAEKRERDEEETDEQ